MLNVEAPAALAPQPLQELPSGIDVLVKVDDGDPGVISRVSNSQSRAQVASSHDGSWSLVTPGARLKTVPIGDRGLLRGDYNFDGDAVIVPGAWQGADVALRPTLFGMQTYAVVKNAGETRLTWLLDSDEGVGLFVDGDGGVTITSGEGDVRAQISSPKIEEPVAGESAHFELDDEGRLVLVVSRPENARGAAGVSFETSSQTRSVTVKDLDDDGKVTRAVGDPVVADALLREGTTQSPVVSSARAAKGKKSARLRTSKTLYPRHGTFKAPGNKNGRRLLDVTNYLLKDWFKNCGTVGYHLAVGWKWRYLSNQKEWRADPDDKPEKGWSNPPNTTDCELLDEKSAYNGELDYGTSYNGFYVEERRFQWTGHSKVKKNQVTTKFDIGGQAYKWLGVNLQVDKAWGQDAYHFYQSVRIDVRGTGSAHYETNSPYGKRECGGRTWQRNCKMTPSAVNASVIPGDFSDYEGGSTDDDDAPTGSGFYDGTDTSTWTPTDRIGIITQCGSVSIKEGALTAPWTGMSDCGSTKKLGLGTSRIMMQNICGDLYAKDGSLNSPLYTLYQYCAPQKVVTTGNRIVVMTKCGSIDVKEGGMGAQWTNIAACGNAIDIAAASNRIGFVHPCGSVQVKEGALNSLWNEIVACGTASKRILMAGTRVGVINACKGLDVKEGPLWSSWVAVVPCGYNIKGAAMSATRIGFITDCRGVQVKEGGLSAAWVNAVNACDTVTSLGLTDSRIVVRRECGQISAKEGGISAPWGATLLNCGESSSLSVSCPDSSCNSSTGSIDTTIETQPVKSPARNADLNWTFSGDGGSTFECSVDGGGWTACGASYSLTAAGLADGTHTLAVRALDDLGGLPDLSPATTTFDVDNTAPETSVSTAHEDAWRTSPSAPDDLSVLDEMADVNLDDRADAVAVDSLNNWYVRLAGTNSLGDWTKWRSPFGLGKQVYVADVTGDGRADALTFDPETGIWQVAPALSGSNGFSETSSTWLAANSTTSNAKVMLADVNHDQRADVVAFDRVTANWSVATSNGSSFNAFATWRSNFGAGSTNQMIKDVTGDNNADAVVYFDANQAVYVAPSNAAGTQFTGTPYQDSIWTTVAPAGSSAQFLADVNYDGKADAVAQYDGTGDWYVALAGSGSFGAWTRWAGGFGAPSDQAFVADLTGDHRADAVVHGEPSDKWEMIAAKTTGNGFDSAAAEATWTSSAATGTTTTSLIGDVNGDGSADAVTRNRTTDSVSVAVADPNSKSFGTWSTWRSGSTTSPLNVLLGDVTGDHRDDLVYVDSGRVWSTAAANSNGTAFAAGTPTVWSTADPSTTAPQTRLLADINGDGKKDAVALVGDGSHTPVYVALSTGTGFGAWTQRGNIELASGSTVVAGDVNGDGEDDLAYYKSGGTWHLFVKPQGGNFDENQYINASTPSGSLNFLADVNGDGLDDVIYRHPTSREWFVLQSSGTAVATAARWKIDIGGNSTVALAGDVNGDHRADAISLRDSTAVNPSSAVWNVSLTAESSDAGNGGSRLLAIDPASLTGEARPAKVDTDSDDDLVAFESDSGDWFVSKSQGSSYGAWTRWRANFGATAEAALLGDVTGDGRDDAVAVWPQRGLWQVAPANAGETAFSGSILSDAIWTTAAPRQATVALLADVNLDQRADAVAIDPATGQWSVALSNGSAFGAWTVWRSGFGADADNYFVRDVTGDGRGDAVYYVEETGSWYVAASIAGQSKFDDAAATATAWRTGFGTDADQIELRDVTGGGAADALAYYADGAKWYVATSTGTAFTGSPGAESLWSSVFGSKSYRRAIGDATGDGKADLIALHQKDNEIHVARSTGTAFSSLAGAALRTVEFDSSDLGASFECSIDSGAWAPCQSPLRPTGLASGSHGIAVRAVDSAGNADASPSTTTIVVDATAPVVTITAPATGTMADNTPALAFTATDANPIASTTCSVDGGTATSCSSGSDLAQLSDGSHTLVVSAADNWGNVGTATRSFSVDTVVPDTTITSGPANGGSITSTSATFAFTASEAGATFECKVDAGSYAACTSPFTATGLSYASHTFSVRAKDAAGNTDASPATRTFNVITADTTAPTAPTNVTASSITATSAVLNWTASTDNVGVTEYDIYRNSSFVAGVWNGGNPPATTYTLTGLTCNTTYPINVVALDAASNWTVSATLSLTTASCSGAPTVTITSPAAGQQIASTSASVAFTTTGSPTGITCKLDAGTATACTSPAAYSGLSQGSHTVTVTATNASGSGSAVATFTVDTIAPDTSFTSAPADNSVINNPTPTFAFSSTEAGSTFECKVDTNAFAGCSSPATSYPLTDGVHSASVRAKDAAGNIDATPVTRTFTVDTVAPDTTITSGPAAGSTITTASTSFSFSSEAGATFECKMDAGTYAACTSPYAVSSLANGSHTFSVRAKDAAGNTDASPATRTFTVSVP